MLTQEFIPLIHSKSQSSLSYNRTWYQTVMRKYEKNLPNMYFNDLKKHGNHGDHSMIMPRIMVTMKRPCRHHGMIMALFLLIIIVWSWHGGHVFPILKSGCYCWFNQEHNWNRNRAFCLQVMKIRHIELHSHFLDVDWLNYAV